MTEPPERTPLNLDPCPLTEDDFEAMQRDFEQRAEDAALAALAGRRPVTAKPLPF